MYTVRAPGELYSPFHKRRKSTEFVLNLIFHSSLADRLVELCYMAQKFLTLVFFQAWA